MTYSERVMKSYLVYDNEHPFSMLDIRRADLERLAKKGVLIAPVLSLAYKSAYYGFRFIHSVVEFGLCYVERELKGLTGL